MAESIKFKNDTYIDTSGVWDSDLDMTQSSFNDSISKALTYKRLTLGNGFSYNSNLTSNMQLECFIVNNILYVNGYVVPKISGTELLWITITDYKCAYKVEFPLGGYSSVTAEGICQAGSNEFKLNIISNSVGNALRFNFTALVYPITA